MQGIKNSVNQRRRRDSLTDEDSECQDNTSDEENTHESLSLRKVKKAIQRERFCEKNGQYFAPTCMKGHILKRYHHWQDSENTMKSCDQCGDPIVEGSHYMNCGEKQCRYKSYCKICFGCPAGHLVGIFRLDQLENTSRVMGPCDWCGEPVQPS